MADHPIRLICCDCGHRHGRRPCGIATWHYGTCDICGAAEMVTELRDFGGLREDRAGGFGRPPLPSTKEIDMIGTKCIIRCYASGVHYGTVAGHEGRQVTLTDSRRLWRWHTGGKDKGVSLSAVALTGIDAGKSTVEPVLPSIVLLDALEIIPCSEAAIASIEAA